VSPKKPSHCTRPYIRGAECRCRLATARLLDLMLQRFITVAVAIPSVRHTWEL